MTPDLTATKLQPPLPPLRLVRRSRLDDLLTAGADDATSLVLLSAPAGSGKSTLLASWLAGRSEPVAWLQVEDTDSDPARFWSYLVEAVRRARPASGDLRPVVAGSAGDEQVVVPALVNALAAVPDPLIVVVDDYHLIDSDSVHRGMERLVDLCPPQVTLVLATRSDPPFRLGRLRVRGRLVEVRGADLRFDAGEATALLDRHAGALDPQHLNALCARTEGWAAALVLAGQALDRADDPAGFVNAFGGDDTLVVEYLRDELLTALAADDRERLLETSVLEQLSGPLVDAVTGGTGGDAWLRDTAATNQLLIGLDRTGTWFRYHHLLRDLLRLEAQQTLPDRLPGLHSRAAQWFADQGDRGPAVVHHLAAGDLAQAARLLRAEGPRLLAQGRSESLRTLLDQLGDDARATGWYALLYAWCDFFAGRYASSDRWVDRLVDAAPAGADLAPALAVRMNNALARGDLGTALGEARSLLAADRLPAHSCTVAAVTGVVLTWAGQHDDARRCLRLAVDKATEEKVPTVHLMALVHLAVVELDTGSATRANEASAAAVQAAEGFGLTSFHGVAPAYAVRARTGSSPEQSRADALRAVATARRASTPITLGFVLATAGDTLLDRRDDGGGLLLAEARQVLDGLPDVGVARRHLSLAEARHGVGPRAAPRVPALVAQLTERETAVLRYLPTTKSQRDIAGELYVSLNTVKTHCQAIYRKLGAADRRAAVQTARDLRLL
jgi:LuxR family transcriptional regulator, maltose regulon positive regulatory protein